MYKAKRDKLRRKKPRRQINDCYEQETTNDFVRKTNFIIIYVSCYMLINNLFNYDFFYK